MKKVRQKVLISFSFVLLVMLLFLTPGTPLESLTTASAFSWISSNPQDLETTYDVNSTFNFTTTWNSTNDIDSVDIIHNFSGTQTTNPATPISNSTWYYTISNISAGNYVWSMTATDNESIIESSPEFDLVILKKQPNLTLKLNGLEENIEILENETVQIQAQLNEGSSTPKLYINSNLTNTSKNVSLNKSLEIGINNITFAYEESQNYSKYNLTRQVEVLEIPLSLKLSKSTLNLKEAGTATINTSGGPTTILIYDLPCNQTIGYNFPLNVTNHNGSYPLSLDLYSDKAANYCVVVNLTDHNKVIRKDYVVVNSITLRTTGDLTVKPNQKTNILAEAKDGFSPYTFKWILDDGFKEVTGNKLEETFTQTGEFDVVLEVTDNKGNVKTKDLVVSVKNQYKLTLTVKDKTTNSVISGAEVLVDDESALTSSTGKVELNLFEGTKQVEVFKENYNTYDEDITLNANKALEVLLQKSVPTSTTNNQNKIQIISPIGSQTQATLVKFEANINPSSTSICKLYVAKDSADWFEELKSFTISTQTKIEHTEELLVGDYNWRIECEGESTTYSTQTNKFTVSQEQQASITASSTSFDAGNLRAEIEEAQNNINSLSFEDQKAVVALDIQTQVSRALRDFDRTLRDINSLMFRRDLSQDQINERIAEYQELLKEIERNTPSTISTLDSKTFVAYPSQEAVQSIASQYQDQKNIVGNVNSASLGKLQEKIVVQTQALTARITYINGTSKDVTIISKQIEYKENTSRNEFLVEKIPSEANINAQNINFLVDTEIISNNPLLKLGLENNFTYYFEGLMDLELAEDFTTLILSDSSFARQQGTNYITGLVTGVNLDVSTPIWSMIVLVILIIAYLVHAFDVFDKLKRLLSKSSDKKVHQIKMLINDAHDYLAADNIDRANLIFKEVKYNYEKSNDFIKKQVYHESIKLYDALNLKYLTNLLTDLESASSNLDKDNSVLLYNKIIESSNDLEPEAKKLVNEKLSKIHLELSKKFPEVFN